MEKILLINPNRMKPLIAPLGLELVCGSLERAGYQLELFDLALYGKDYEKKLLEKIAELKPYIIGISIRNLDDCYFLSQKFLLGPIKTLVRKIKKHSKASIVLGGVGYSLSPNAVLDYLSSDFGIAGDGEDSFPLLVSALLKGKGLEGVAGLISKDFQAKDPAIADFYQERCSRSYVDNLFYFQKGGQGSIETKRGCDGKCIYCADPVAKGRKIRLRSPDAVVEELEELVKLGVNIFHSCDSEFNRPIFHSYQVLEGIISKGLEKKIGLYAYCSPHPFDEELAHLFSRAGGIGINFGADSGSAQILENLGRDHNPDDIAKAVSYCKKYKIRVMLDLLLGGPGETRKTIRETVNLMKKIKPDRVGISFGVRVFNRTPLCEYLQKQGSFEDNPEVIGKKENNPELMYPVFYLPEGLQKDGVSFIEELVSNDLMFLLPFGKKTRNYNYNQNLFLEKLIKKGARGAYWDILLCAEKKRKETNSSLYV